MTKWEYQVRPAYPEINLLYALNEVGSRGWELAGVVSGTLIFKRPVEEREG